MRIDMGLTIGDIAYLREPEGGHNAGIVSQMGGGMVRLVFSDNYQASYFYNELL